MHQQEISDRLQSFLKRSEEYSKHLLDRLNNNGEEGGRLTVVEHNQLIESTDREGEEGIENNRLVPVFNKKPSDEFEKKSRKRRQKSTGSPERKKCKGISNSPSQFVNAMTKKSSKSVESRTHSNVDGDGVPDSQPRLLVGGVIKQHQIEGMKWLIGLYENGVNGILADETGLAKTLQSVALICKLIEQKVEGPFLIVAQSSRLSNWVSEFRKFAPQIHTVLYYGIKDQLFGKSQGIMRIKKYDNNLCSLPVVLTSYEVLMYDTVPLSVLDVQWKYIIVDGRWTDGCINCNLIKALNSYNTANRLLLTATPPQDDLTELWSLLLFLLPDDFSKFQQWFDSNDVSFSDFIVKEQEAAVLRSLHRILSPFLLRREICRYINPY